MMLELLVVDIVLGLFGSVISLIFLLRGLTLFFFFFPERVFPGPWTLSLVLFAECNGFRRFHMAFLASS